MRIPLAAAGRREITIITVIFGGLASIGYIAAATGLTWGIVVGPVATCLWLAGVLFFRDPERTTPDEPGILVAPADGKIVETIDLDHHEDVGGPATRISIFLSVLDVHINRSPCAGTIQSIRYQPGRFLDARDERSGQMNESNTIVIQPDNPGDGPVVVRQIAGLIARRIVCSAKVGDRVSTGQRIGMIKFGSRTELIIASQNSCRPAVRVGDTARAASTILARREPETATAPVGS